MHMVSVVLGIGFTNWKLDWLLPHYVPVRLAVQLRRNAKQDWNVHLPFGLGVDVGGRILCPERSNLPTFANHEG